MSSVIQKLCADQLVTPPAFVATATQYEVVTGSVAYGMADESSDWDIYGFCIPFKEMIFPHLRGEILGFGHQIQRFEQWQKHRVETPKHQYDLQIYSIIKYFQLCMENNPNMIDTLFVPQRCILHSTKIGNMVREARRSFLHRGCWHKFRGYAFSQLHKAQQQEREGKRKDDIEQFGWDRKFLSHVVRLINEVEQILAEGDLDLERNRQMVAAVRSGEWSLTQVQEWFNVKEKTTEELYAQSKLPWGPPEDQIRQLLFACLEEHFGSLDQVIVQQDRAISALRKIENIAQETLRIRE